jgi:hypothetical protein
MDTNLLLQIAREIISKVPTCFAITVDQDGHANARVVADLAIIRRLDSPLYDGPTITQGRGDRAIGQDDSRLSIYP